jgi:hypothetical protein
MSTNRLERALYNPDDLYLAYFLQQWCKRALLAGDAEGNLHCLSRKGA